MWYFRKYPENYTDDKALSPFTALGPSVLTSVGSSDRPQSSHGVPVVSLQGMNWSSSVTPPRVSSVGSSSFRPRLPRLLCRLIGVSGSVPWSLSVCSFSVAIPEFSLVFESSVF